MSLFKQMFSDMFLPITYFIWIKEEVSFQFIFKYFNMSDLRIYIHLIGDQKYYMRPI